MEYFQNWIGFHRGMDYLLGLLNIQLFLKDEIFLDSSFVCVGISGFLN